MTAAQVTPQHEQALEKANRVKKARADVKRDLRTLPTDEARGVAAAVIEDPNELLVTMPVDSLLVAIRRWGREHAVRLLVRAMVSPVNRPIGALTERQRDVLTAALRGDE